MIESNFDEVWKPVQSVIELRRLDYEEAVTIGGSFGTLRAEIMRLQEQNKRYLEVLKFYADKSMYVRYVSALDGLTSDIDFDKGERARKILDLK